MNAINWFDLFVTDLPRAVRFYETVLAAELPIVEFMGGRMAMFPCAENAVGGCLCEQPQQRPGAGGSRIYLNVDGRLDAVLERVPTADGQILQGKTSIAPHGFIAVIKDSEGNEVGLHSLS